jgi:membrane-associated protein
MQIVDLILHVDKFLPALLAQYGAWIYVILFVVIFCETGLVVTPFLPGDSLLFAAGALAAMDHSGTVSIWLLFAILTTAAIAGDNSNYWIGRTLGKKLMSNPNSRVFRPEYIEKTEHFFARYGAKAVVLARFVVIVRTFAPFLAGLGHMRYPKFLAFSVAGGVTWMALFLAAGYFFGAIPVVQENLLYVSIGVIAVTTVPIAIEYLRHRRDQKAAAAAAAGE